MNTYSRESHITYPAAVDSCFQALMFAPLNSDGSNFLEWINDARIILNTEDLVRTLHPLVPSTSSESEVQIPVVCKWQALSLLRRHLDHALQLQYLNINDLADMWVRKLIQSVRALGRKKIVDDKSKLHFLDFVSFNSELHRITAQLRLCGQTVTDAELIEKTLFTFPAATTILSQQYWNMNFTKHFHLMSHLLLAKKHQQLLLKNAESRPTQEVHSTIVAANLVHVGPVGLVRLAVAKVHAAQASSRPPKGSYWKSQHRTLQERCEPMARVMCIRDMAKEMYIAGESNLGLQETHISLGITNPSSFRVIITSVGVKVT